MEEIKPKPTRSQLYSQADEDENKNAGRPYTVHYMLGKACFEGDVELVKDLLLDERVDPGTPYSILLGTAIAQGHIAVAEILLNDKRVIPLQEDLFKANEAGYVGVVDMIKQNPNYIWFVGEIRHWEVWEQRNSGLNLRHQRDRKGHMIWDLKLMEVACTGCGFVHTLTRNKKLVYRLHYIPDQGILSRKPQVGDQCVTVECACDGAKCKIEKLEFL